MSITRRPATLMAGIALMTFGACSGPLDFDLRGGIGNGLDTADAARNATADRPEPDSRGIISYPSYQVAIARRGDTLGDLAGRIGVDANELARYNGIQKNDLLRKGEVIALPNRVAEPEGGPIRPLGSVDITSIAGNAIDEADADQIETSALKPVKKQTGVEPVRHKVLRGETAYSIARLYNVSIRSLAEWNGLGSDFRVREGQHLLIPVALPGDTMAPFDATDFPQPEPGEGSVTPEPPSADKPLPEEDTVAVSDITDAGDAPDLGASQTSASKPKARMAYPVRGDIIRAYSKGKNDGVDIAASPGSSVKAADKGVVAAITEDTNGTPIVVIKHSGNILTVYSNVSGVSVAQGDAVQRGQNIAQIPKSGTAAMHFEVRDGFNSLDPMPFLTK